jgi:dethiobiotin synthetase
VTALALIELLRAAGLRPLGIKALETGCRPDADHELEPRDGKILWQASAIPGVPLEVAAPYRFSRSGAPLEVIEQAGLEVRIRDIAVEVDAARRWSDALVVEGAAGAEVAIASDGDEIDLAAGLAARLVIVQGGDRAALERILAAAAERAVPVAGVVLSPPGADLQVVLQNLGVPSVVAAARTADLGFDAARLARAIEGGPLAQAIVVHQPG